MVYSFNAQSQSYYPIIETNKYWDQSNSSANDSCFFLPNAYRYEFTSDDTVINGGYAYRFTKAHPLFGEGDSGLICPPFRADTNSYLFAWLREDTSTRKVYVYSQISNPTDQLLYDFNLNIGDTLHSDYASQGSILVLDTIQMVTLQNGEIRKQYIFNQPWISYIEGIGGVRGLFLPLNTPQPFTTTLYCVKKSGINLWGSLCSTVFLGISKDMNISCKVFPNPFYDELNIRIENSKLTKQIEFEIFDLNGTTVFTNELQNPNTSFSLSKLTSGFYIYRIKMESSTHYGSLIKL